VEEGSLKADLIWSGGLRDFTERWLLGWNLTVQGESQCSEGKEGIFRVENYSKAEVVFRFRKNWNVELCFLFFKHAPCRVEPSLGLELPILRSRPEIKSRMLNRMSHPGAPHRAMFKVSFTLRLLVCPIFTATPKVAGNPQILFFNQGFNDHHTPWGTMSWQLSSALPRQTICPVSQVQLTR